ncbi:GNAT family N-acetyltransferase [Kutzneria kofuensis]|uniref:RimJ/RimL family protein N-acetyltransferase n=2 Tax=Kutzneria kofuensis TaxID=103725 RepID=A0A7W9KPB3_9PSEU|nr:GNAT family N-acetyltransferase [Kutzneria kofuensis]MBB5896248.1 RimJ/RimL family protein N-acetyltransferase [Kutzneria kofuensis]
MSWLDIARTTLEDDRVRLSPLRPEDRESLHAIAFDPDIWRYFVTRVDTEQDFQAFFDATLADHQSGVRAVFHIVDKKTGRGAGSMSYGNLAERDGRLEIGWSWLGRDFRGRGVNGAAKNLLLAHAFDRMGAERVEFKTDRRNEQARRGLRNIGATEEGTLRSFNPMPDGTRRDAVYYSVLRAEWPAVRQRLAG